MAIDGPRFMRAHWWSLWSNATTIPYHFAAKGAAKGCAPREQAVAHNLNCIRIGKLLGSKALTLWIGDGANFPGQQHLVRAYERYLDSARQIYAGLPEDWRLLIEHKMYEPAFYATVIQDWGSSSREWCRSIDPHVFS